MNPSDILFKQRRGTNNSVLFNSQIELVKSLISTEGSYLYGKDQGAVKAVVNHVINGKRRLTEEFKNSLFLIIENKFGKLPEIEVLKYKLVDTFDKNYDRRQMMVKIDKGDPGLLTVLARMNIAENVILTSCEIKIHPENNFLKDNFFSKDFYTDSERISAKFHFYFPMRDSHDDDGAFLFWKSLFIYAKKNNIDDFEKKMTSDNPPVKVYTAPKELCIFPVVIFDINTNAEVGFFVSEFENKMNAVILNKNIIRSWKSNIYSKLSSCREFLFVEAKPDIEKNSDFVEFLN